MAKERHGCLTLWLVLIFLANIASASMYPFMNEMVKLFSKAAPAWSAPLYLALSIFNLACIIALFRWKKWGFYGICVSAAIATVANSSLDAPLLSLLGPAISLLILYGVLQIGGTDKGWPQLE